MNINQFLNWCDQSLEDCKRSSLVMGILNITHNSFYDGGSYLDHNLAYERAHAMIKEGVDIIDVGGESSKPGARPISLNEELDRVIPVIEKIRATSDVCISIDTCKPLVMQEAIAAGASCINDISALTADNALSIAASLEVPIILMHMKGRPIDMQVNPHYDGDLVDEINSFFKQRIAACLNAGIARNLLILDPGFGFGKSVQHNIEIMRRIQEFRAHKLPLLLGVSRKSTLLHILNQGCSDLLYAGVALTVFAATQGASIFRTHDILATKQALQTIDFILFK